ncbi:permease YjgP/YjgQ [Nitrosococcus oceani ATCC 19707]|uniref:Lipopolysaccharide export system permease protein LptF n=2 Tax=Nitrosococcus oceani TaxID=1229 RepID=Q3J9X2_NITOC|nr:LPS export ABC transporter permease LptF [Nitrosococcus oceani]ABA58374.1 permease YjgP/YjgQ [Nitrosococcus oceani ATCC 19707]EDZ66701.1 putative permease, YjgP/YjgQ family [Nitrosococcus oceani AFC27]KFI19180.1 permease [Nitrosococcus oceani C-27]GEM18765.1 LPS export ABC transporter permease LptF [Nitrosococcus oceani]
MFKLLIVDRYILKELSLNATAITLVLLLIFGGIRFIRFLSQATEGKVPGEAILALSGYEAIGALVLLLPLASFLAVLLALGRMGADNEVIALFACGVSRGHLLRVVLTFGLALAIGVGGISLYLGPAASAEGYRLKQQALLAAETSGLVAGNFKEAQHGQRVFYAESLTEDGLGMKNVFIQVWEPTQKTLLRAARGHLQTDEATGDKYLILEDGYRYELMGEEVGVRIFSFERHGILVKKGGAQEFRIRHQTLPTLTLWEMGAPKDIAEVQWRISMPIITLLLVMLAVPLARSGPRQGRYAGLVPAVLVYVIYSNMLGIARNWVEHEVIPASLGLWWIHGLVLLVVLISLWPRPLWMALHQARRLFAWVRPQKISAQRPAA